MLSKRCTDFLKSRGYLSGCHSPAHASRILAAFRHMDPKAYEAAEKRAKALGGRQRWLIMRDMCAIYNVNLLPLDSPDSGGPVQVMNFYTTKSWRYLRMKVLAARGARCECCGATAKDGARIHVDHIKPRSRYPELELDEDNLQVLCADCNLGKMAWDMTDWRAEGEAA